MCVLGEILLWITFTRYFISWYNFKDKQNGINALFFLLIYHFSKEWESALGTSKSDQHVCVIIYLFRIHSYIYCYYLFWCSYCLILDRWKALTVTLLFLWHNSLVFNSFLAIWYKMAQVHLIYCLRPGFNDFSEEPWFLLVRNHIYRPQSECKAYLLLLVCHCFKDFSMGRWKFFFFFFFFERENFEFMLIFISQFKS